MAKRRRKRNQAVVTAEEIREALQAPEDFGYSGDLPLFDTWALGPVIDFRDATVLTRANRGALERALGEHPEWEEQWAIVGAGHYEVGWVDHLAFEVVDQDGAPTAIFVFLKAWFTRLAEVSVVADTELFAEIQEQAYVEALVVDLEALEGRLYEGLPGDWKAQMAEALAELPRAYDERDVPYHPFADLEETADQLGYLDLELAGGVEMPTFVVFRDRSTSALVSGQLLVLAEDATSLTFQDELSHRELQAHLRGSVWVIGEERGTFEIVQLTTPRRSMAANPIGPGLAATLGSWAGTALASITMLPLNLGVGAGMFLYWTLSTVGAGVGGYMAAPEDRKRRVTVGSTVGNLLLPFLGIGAAIGGFVGGRYPDPQEVQELRELRRSQGKRFNPAEQHIRAIKRRVMR